MAKRFRLKTRAFGAEPGQPDVAALAGWVAQTRGRIADMITYRLDVPLTQQVSAGITMPCAGGTFYGDRILAALDGIVDRKAVGELHVDTHEVVEDAAGIVLSKKGAWCAIPAPHVLGISDNYFHDGMEWSDAICGAYRTLLRAMRDTGVEGHVLICDTIDTGELGALAWQKVFFLLPEPDRAGLSLLLERQQQVAIRKEDLPLVFSLMDEYDVHRISIIDPDASAIASALTRFDADQIEAGGYCTADNPSYWNDLVTSAEYTV